MMRFDDVIREPREPWQNRQPITALGEQRREGDAEEEELDAARSGCGMWRRGG
jgi:hypothetical protein